jgi:hypothetical protein
LVFIHDDEAYYNHLRTPWTTFPGAARWGGEVASRTWRSTIGAEPGKLPHAASFAAILAAKESLRNNMVAAVSLGERLCSSIPRESYPGGDRFPTSFSLTFFPAGLRYDVKRRGL